MHHDMPHTPGSAIELMETQEVYTGVPLTTARAVPDSRRNTGNPYNTSLTDVGSSVDDGKYRPSSTYSLSARSDAYAGSMSGSPLRPKRSHDADLEDGELDEYEQQGSALKRNVTMMRQNTVRMRDRWVRRGKPTVGVLASLKAIMTASALNWFLIFVPLSWTAHFIQIKREEADVQSIHAQHMMMAIVFASSFLAIMPLVRLFEYVGQQMVYYVGKHFGRFLVITLSNAVEVTLGLILLGQCQLKLLQSTLIGVVVLNLLLIPGTSFITGGARTDHQELQTHSEDMQHTLLTIGVLSLLLPAAFFSSMRTPTHQDTGDESVPLPVNEQSRQILLHISHGIAVLLIIVYIGFMYFSRKPPGTREERRKMQRDEEEKMDGEPEINQYVGVVALTCLVVFMAFTAEWLLSTIHFLEEEGHVNKEFFGIMLLPLISFSADGFVALINYCRNTFRHLFGRPIPAVKIAEAQAIDMSIQFLLLWIPFIEVIAWITDRPLLLLFDIFEVSLIVSACFLVNYVTEDSKTNWAEGLAMVAFYFMIGILAWFYKGQASVENLLYCGSVADAVAGKGTSGHH